MKMPGQAAACALAAALVAGCAPFAVNWYHEPAVGDPAEDDVVLVVLNRSERLCRVQSIRLNEDDASAPAFRWPTLDGPKARRARQLRPGSLLTISLAEFKWTMDQTPSAEEPQAFCTLPVRIDITASGCGWRETDEFTVHLPPRLPNALPDSWTKCPDRPPRAQAGGDPPLTTMKP